MPLQIEKTKMQPEYIEAMIEIITSITGLSYSELEHLDEQHLFTYLSFVMQWNKEQIQAMFAHQQQGAMLDIVSINKFWNLINKSIIKYQANADKRPVKVIEDLIIKITQNANQAMLDPSAKFSSSAGMKLLKNEPHFDFSRFHSLLVNQIIPAKSAANYNMNH